MKSKFRLLKDKTSKDIFNSPQSLSLPLLIVNVYLRHKKEADKRPHFMAYPEGVLCAPLELHWRS